MVLINVPYNAYEQIRILQLWLLKNSASYFTVHQMILYDLFQRKKNNTAETRKILPVQRYFLYTHFKHFQSVQHHVYIHIKPAFWFLHTTIFPWFTYRFFISATTAWRNDWTRSAWAWGISSKESQKAPPAEAGLCLVSPVLVWYDTQNRCQMFVNIMATVLLAIVAFQR